MYPDQIAVSRKQHLLLLLLFPALELLPEVIPLLLVAPILVIVISSMALPILFRLLSLAIILCQISPGSRILQPYFLQTSVSHQPS